VLKRALLAVAIAAVALAGGAVGVRSLVDARCFSLAGEPICRVETQAPLVALTIDDGPTQEGVDAVLPVLDRHGAKATFFLVGAEVRKRPDLAARIAAAGHELGNHSYSHSRMIFRPAAFYAREIAETERLLAAAGGGSGLFRPPYGKKLVGLPRAVERQGLIMVMWDVEDPVTADPQVFARQVVAEAQPGSIILVHAMSRRSPVPRQALPLILDGLARKGLRVVSVGDLLAATERSGVNGPSGGP